METPDLDTALSDLMEWIAAVTDALTARTVPIVHAIFAELPGALRVAVRPDAAGRNTALALIKWAVPDLAIVVGPAQQPSYELYLEGEQRAVIICNSQPREGDDHDTDTRWLSDEERERIEARLIEITDDLLRGDPDWHPTAPAAAADLIDAYFTDYHGGDSRAEVSAIVEDIPVHKHLWEAGQERKLDHAAAWAREANHIAQELLNSPDGHQLRTATKP